MGPQPIDCPDWSSELIEFVGSEPVHKPAWRVLRKSPELLSGSPLYRAVLCHQQTRKTKKLALFDLSCSFSFLTLARKNPAIFALVFLRQDEWYDHALLPQLRLESQGKSASMRAGG